jgi:alkylation response protein AidB-like acyl-CoA dehydrogenase
MSRAEVSAEVHTWLEAHWHPEMTLREWWAKLAASGWSQPHWPVDWYGRGLTERESVAVANVIAAFGAVNAPSSFGTAMAGPTLLAHGTDEQLSRHLPGIADGTDAFCQLFSEPNAGSDLAGLQCRADRDGDVWVANGQKVWTSRGQFANKGMLLARTNPNVAKHSGISYFIIDVRQPGVEIRPLREMTGRSFFNEVFITDARIPDVDLVGGEGNGWAVANTTLAFERSGSGGRPVTIARAGEIAGDLDKPAGTFVLAPDSRASLQQEVPAAQLMALARSLGREQDPLLRDRLMRLHTLEFLREITARRGRDMQLAGRDLAGLANLSKMAINHECRLARDLIWEILGPAGMLHGYTPGQIDVLHAHSAVPGHADLIESALFMQAPPIYAGSDQIQRNIVGDRTLGLPREPNVEKGIPFKDLRKNP